MTLVLQQIPVLFDVNVTTLRDEVFAKFRPVVLKGLVRSWPAVSCGLQSHRAMAEYLQGFASQSDVDSIMIPPGPDRSQPFNRQISYTDDFGGFNFVRNRLPIAAVLDQLLRYAVFDNPPAVAVQSALLDDCLPGFAAENRLPIGGEHVVPRIWLGNRITVPAHIDQSNNIACVVSGRRRFMLFPPEQVANLYIGPLDFAPTGLPTSVAQLADPDFVRFPKLRDALAAAQVAELEPGDAIYIPTLWWHHVESLDRLNILVNYWWSDTIGGLQHMGSPMDCLFHSLLNIRGLPSGQRQAWAAIFNHYVFDIEGASAEHIPVHRQGVLGSISPALDEKIREILIEKLST